MAITIPILTDFKGDGLDRGIAQFKKLEGTGAKAGFLIRKAALPAAAALGALGAGAAVAAKAAAEDAAAQEKLAGTLSRVTGASDAAVASTEDYISALSQSVGVADDELRPALGRLATATGDLSKAQELLGIALDVSAQTGKPLETVTTALSKAYGGNFGALNRLIPGFDQGIIKSKDFTKAQAELAKLTGGAAAENANTAAGQFRKFQITLEETKESIGAALLPIFQAFLPILQKAAQFVQNNSNVVVVLAGVIAGLAGAILAANAAMKVYTTAAGVMRVAQLALNLVMAMNPIGLLITALAALVTGLTIAYTSSESFRNVVNTMFEAVKTAFGWIASIASTYFNGLKTALGFIETAGSAVGEVFKTAYNAGVTIVNWIKGIAGGAFDTAKKAFDLLSEPIGVVGSAFKTAYEVGDSIFRFLRGIARGAFATAAAAFRALSYPIEAVAAALSRAKQLWEWFKAQVQGEGGNPFAPGGSLAGPVGNMPGRRSAMALDATPMGLASAFGSAPTIIVNVDAGLVSTPDQIGQQIIEAIQVAQRRSGPVFAYA
jgi:hypothetical protein